MSEVAVLTLSEFLLARIAEDEAVAREVEAEDARVQRVIGYEHDGSDLSFWTDFDGARPSVSVGAARVLAECAAKRAIVELHSEGTDPSDCTPYGRRPTGEPCDTLRHLAAVYADHPDYHDEWKP